MTTEPNHRKQPKPQLRVVFDTNVLYTGSASDLVRQEVAALVKDGVFPDLEIKWYLPQLVRHERQYQMQKRALELLPSIAKMEKLLGHNLAITEQVVIERVEKAVSQRHDELNFVSLPLDYTRVDWNQVALDAAFRRPPFQDGETEKGFRDRLIVESFLQLVADSPKTPKVCRVVLVSGDKLLAETVEARTGESTNTSAVSTLEELKGLINTLVSQVDETFLASLKPKAEKLFFIPKEESTLFYKEQIREKLRHKFAAELAAPPQGATSRTNGTWVVRAPNFVKKTGRRIHWASRLVVEAEASKEAPQSPLVGSYLGEPPSAGFYSESPAFNNLYLKQNAFLNLKQQTYDTKFSPLSTLLEPESVSLNDMLAISTASMLKTHKGIDVYEVLWSADVTTSRELRRPTIDGINHVGPTWEQVT